MREEQSLCGIVSVSSDLIEVRIRTFRSLFTACPTSIRSFIRSETCFCTSANGLANHRARPFSIPSPQQGGRETHHVSYLTPSRH